MNKLAISIAVAVALGLSGCGDSLDDIKQDAAQPGGTVIPSSRVLFDPSAAVPVLSVPNDLLFQFPTVDAAGNRLYTDATLFMPKERDDRGFPLPFSDTNYADPETAIGALDGWSTQNPFTVALSFAPGVSLNADSASTPGSVRLFKALMGDPRSPDADCRALPRGLACKIVTELEFGRDFYTAPSGNSVAVIPFKPLEAETTYLLALTDGLKDSNNESIKPSTSYEIVKQDPVTLPLATAAQRSLQAVINSFENVMQRDKSVSKDSIIYTAAFTTQSTATVLSTTKNLFAAKVQAGMPPILTVESASQSVSDVGNQFPVSQGFGLVRLFKGEVTLPYYSGLPTNDNPEAPLNISWRARCDSGAIIASLSASEIAALESQLSGEQLQNDMFCKSLPRGALRDFGLDKARHLTKFNPVPRENENIKLSVQITVPDETAFTRPANGWPVVMLQHGITSCKENMLAVTSSLTQAGFATVAIDHPLHGSRGFGALNASGDTCGSQYPVGGNATVYMNLANLLVTRDNLRQSISDMLGLRLALNFVQGINIDSSTVHLLGHSLGGMTGASMAALANTTTDNDTLDAMFKIQSVGLAAPGGAVANFLLDSPRFGSLIRANVILGATDNASKAIAQKLTVYAVGEGCELPSAQDASTLKAQQARFIGCVATKVDVFLNELATGTPAQKAEFAIVSANLARFAFAAQTIVDAGDPNNYLAALQQTATPVHILQISGDGAAKLPDQVIPNGFFSPVAALRAGKMPLAGTEPMARLLQAKTINAVAGPVAVEQATISRFIDGGHTSLLNPLANAAVTTEMQRQMASFFATNGRVVNVTDTSVLQSSN